MAAMCHTTSAVTMAEGAQMPNILPNKAKAVINYRSLNIDSNNSIIERIKQTINDPETSVRYISGSEASVYSDITTSGYNIVKKAINQTWGTDVVVTPYLMVARSDSRHYSDICDTVCRFCPMELDKEHRNMIHNYNEQMDLKMIDKCIEFYINLLKLI
jgi:carboxypeptidase PM20D1